MRYRRVAKREKSTFPVFAVCVDFGLANLLQGRLIISVGFCKVSACRWFMMLHNFWRPERQVYLFQANICAGRSLHFGASLMG